jgi:hypothetical protein
MPGQYCPEYQAADQPSNVRRIVDAGNHGAEEKIVSSEREQALQRGLQSLRVYRQVAQVERGNKRTGEPENCARGTSADSYRMPPQAHNAPGQPANRVG